MTLRGFHLLSFLFIIGQTCFSQRNESQLWNNIDLAIKQKKNLIITYGRLEDMKQQAFASKNFAEFSRCCYYQMLINDLRTEDTLFFKNSTFIDSILFATASSPELKIFMHLLQAKRLASFRAKSLRFDRTLYEMKNQRFNYAAFSMADLDSAIEFHFEKAKLELKIIPSPPLEEVAWLSSDPSLFLFKPGLRDIILAEQIRFTPSPYPASDALKNKINQLLSLSQKDFIRVLNSVSKEREKEYRAFALYHEWISNKTSASDSFFIETLARKYAFSFRMGNDTAQKLYESYLRKICSSPFYAARAHGVYQLCLRWNKDAANYAPEYSYQDFDTACQYHALKALQLYELNKGVMDSFPSLRNILELMKEQILSKTLKLQMESDNLPGEPILAQLNYKNISQLYYRIVKINFMETVSRKNKNAAAYLSAKRSIREATIDIPSPSDHNNHVTYLKLDPLPAGKYYILLSDKYIEPGDSLSSYLAFNVTGISVLNTDNRVFILNRKTGMPLENAVMVQKYTETNKNKQEIEKEKKYVVNASGFVNIKDDRSSQLYVYYNSDSIVADYHGGNDNAPYDVYDKDEYDDLIEFYEDNAKIHIFTDRSIYRPGQAVYYKAIIITKNPKTGEPLVMNRDNLRNGLLKNVYKKWLKESEPEMYIIDPFNRKVDTIKVIPNEYGSVSGIFNIPANAATGDWSIESEYLDQDYQNSGEFRVEEYKRPTFELSVEKPKKELKPGDEFFFKVKVKSYSGANLNNVQISYSISRDGYIPVEGNENYTNIELTDSFGYTDNNGELVITVNDSLLRKYSFPDNKEWKYTYTIDAEAVDETGESYDSDSKIDISTRPLFIKLPLSGILDRNKLPLPLVTVTDRNAGEVFRKVKIVVYRLIQDKKIYQDKKLQKADQWLYATDQLQNWFPLIQFEKADDEKKELVFEAEVNTAGYERLKLPADKLIAGNYVYETVCNENEKITGTSAGKFSVYDLAEKKLPEETFSFHKLVNDYLATGDTIKLVNGNSETGFYSVYHVSWYSKTAKKIVIKNVYDLQMQSAGLHEWRFRVPDDAVDQLRITQVYVLNNKIYINKEDVYLKKENSKPEIILEQYRQVLHPGASETFSISVKTNNESIVAELMTTMYDASLDKLEEHKWQMPSFERGHGGLTDSWPWKISETTSVNPFSNVSVYKAGKIAVSKAKWWIYSSDPAAKKELVIYGDIITRLEGVTSGLLFETKGFEETIAVNTGYQTIRASSVTGSFLRIRGESSMLDLKQPLIIVDNMPYEGDLSKLDQSLITHAMVLKDAAATSIWGARAGSGVLVISTKGEIKLPIFKPEPVVKIRKNFNETAFFFPKIYADKDGYYKLSFTMPETVTEWNWKLLAHTKKAQFAYVERKINTQLPLMVQPNMPRLLYQDDRIVLQSRISNLDTVAISGKAICKIEDALTGENITSSTIAVSQLDFSIDKKANTIVAFELKTPKDQLSPLKIIITAKGTAYADAEEHIIPVLNTGILVKKTIPFSFSEANDTLINFIPALTTGEENHTVLPKLYGIGLSITPKPQSALINSLPYLANYSYDCAEQVFNKLMAYATAIRIMRTDEQARVAFKRAQNETPDKTIPEVFPDELAEQTMPWLSLSGKALRQQQQLLKLLDTLYSQSMIETHLNKLYKLQNPDGGLTWFSGGKSNLYISFYVLAGFGKLRAEGWEPGIKFRQQFISFISRLLSYSDKHFISVNQNSAFDNNTLYYGYARQFWENSNPPSETILSHLRNYISESWKKADNYNLYMQALLILNTFSYFMGKDDSIRQKAVLQLKSIRQLAIIDETNGLRWKNIADANDLDNSAEETIALLTEAFSASGSDSDIVAGMIKWLLMNRNEHHWNTTKGTSAAISMLLNEKNSIIRHSQVINGTLKSNKLLTVTDNLLSGSAFSFQMTREYSPVNLKKLPISPANGSLTWYYFTEANNINEINRGIKVSKSFFRFNSGENKWEAANKDAQYKIAEKVKVVITVESSKSLRYVYLDDKRSAAFEPSENKSGYEHTGQFSYYRAIRDAGFQFFSDFLPAGKSEFAYELRVAHNGSFTSGPATLQCMYNPGLSAYSNSAKIESVK